MVMGTPPALALGGAGATGMLDWLLQSLLPPSLDGGKAVLAHLQTDAATSSSDDEWPRREGLLISPK
jgi:hypothetical protein